MNPERFSPGVRRQERERRSFDLDRLAEQELVLVHRLNQAGQPDAARMVELFALASSTAEVRASAPALEWVDRQTLQQALEGRV